MLYSQKPPVTFFFHIIANLTFTSLTYCPVKYSRPSIEMGRRKNELYG